MKEVLIFVAIGYAVVQTILLLAILAAAARPTPQFEPQLELEPVASRRENVEELELV